MKKWHILWCRLGKLAGPTRLKRALDGPRRKSAKVEFWIKAVFNTIIQNREEYLTKDYLVLVEPFIVLSWTLNNIPVQILKDDGYNKNIESKQLLNRNLHLFQLISRKCMIQHSEKHTNELTAWIVFNKTLRTVFRTNNTNWLVSDRSYDVLLGAPWHVEYRPTGLCESNCQCE